MDELGRGGGTGMGKDKGAGKGIDGRSASHGAAAGAQGSWTITGTGSHGSHGAPYPPA